MTEGKKMINKQLRISVLIGAFAILSGCTSLNSQFDCPMKPGVVCKSLDDVNTMVDQGKLGGCSPYSNPLSTSVSSRSLAVSSSDTHFKFSHDNPSTKVTRIWIAPYQDKEGDYYTSTLVYRGIKNRWDASSTKVRSDSGEIK
jgi:conjugal transfer pilus assembly protein TraV